MTNGFGPKTPFLIGVAGGTASGKVRNEAVEVEWGMDGRKKGPRARDAFVPSFIALSFCVAIVFRGRLVLSGGAGGNGMKLGERDVELKRESLFLLSGWVCLTGVNKLDCGEGV